MKKALLITLGHLFLIFGLVGAFLPVLPTTPFLLLAAFFYSKSSPRIHRWLIEHKIIGKPIREWEESGVIRPWAKILATVMISLVLVFKIQNLPIHFLIRGMIAVILLLVLIYIWTRPSYPKIKEN